MNRTDVPVQVTLDPGVDAAYIPRACPWADVSSVRRITAGVEIDLPDRRRIRLFTPFGGHLDLLIDTARQNGVSIGD